MLGSHNFFRAIICWFLVRVSLLLLFVVVVIPICQKLIIKLRFESLLYYVLIVILARIVSRQLSGKL